MAANTQVAIGARTVSPIAMWHLLSLDAPTVAALWTWFIGRAAHVQLPIASPAAMFVAVWILYAVDRLLDAAHAPARDLEARHHFHHRHRRAFSIGIAIAAPILATLLRHLNSKAMQLYLAEGALLIVWFIVLHATRSAHRLPKEFAVGLFFSAATFIPTVARVPRLRPEMLPAALIFSALCCLNCLFIYAWEHTISDHCRPHPTTRLALMHLPLLAVTACIAGASLMFLLPSAAKPIAAACSMSAALLLALHHNRPLLSRIDLRAAADLALLTPLLLLPFLA